MRMFAVYRPPQPPTPGDVVYALGKAGFIVKRGWMQHAALTVRGDVSCYCLIAAITAASRTKQIRDATIAAARLALPSRFAGGSLEAFNDDPGTVVGDVTWLLAAAKNFVGQAVAV